MQKKTRKVQKKQIQSKKLLEKLSQCESPNVTYTSDTFPIVMKKGKGLIVTDADGNRYKDFTSCFGVLALGHSSPIVLSAARKQLPKLIHGMGDVHPSYSKIELLHTLQKIAPFANSRAILGLNGSDAVEMALKTAMLVTNKHEFISFAGGYHGLSLGSLPLTNNSLFRNGFEPWIKNKSTIIPFPFSDDFNNTNLLCCNASYNKKTIMENDNTSNPDTVLLKLEETLKQGNIAGIILEPLQGRGGERTWPEHFLTNLSFLSKKYNAMLIFDEIFSGLGRTGSLWAHEKFKIVPDILCAGKAMGGGFPISACMSPLLDVWGKSTGEARHTSTFLGHPLACAVSNKVIKHIVKMLPAINQKSLGIDTEMSNFVARCKGGSIANNYPFIVRGNGFMRGLFFFNSPNGIAAKIAERILQHGYIVLPSGINGNVLSLIPPLISSPTDMKNILNTIHDLLINNEIT